MKSTASRLISLLAFGLLGLSACAQFDAEQGDIVLSGYDESNFEALNAALGTRACVVGRWSVDDTGVYFLLSPYEREGVIRPYASRLRVSAGPDLIAQSQFRDGQLRRVCGVLQDATPGERCTRNDCKWYELREPQVG